MLMLGVNLPFKIACILGFVGMMSHISNQYLSNCSLKCHKVVQQLPEVILIKPTIPLPNFQTFPASCFSLSRIYEHHVFNAHKCCVWNRKFFYAFVSHSPAHTSTSQRALEPLWRGEVK